jgi:hypothetical protein
MLGGVGTLGTDNYRVSSDLGFVSYPTSDDLVIRASAYSWNASTLRTSKQASSLVVYPFQVGAHISNQLIPGILFPEGLN